MRDKTKAFMTAIMTFSLFALVLISIAAAAGAITLTPTAQAPGASVSVAGTSFGATKAVGIGFGAEVAGSNTNMAYSEVGGIGGSGGLNLTGRISNYPIKPGSFTFYSDTGTSGMVSIYNDNGDGTTIGSFEGAVGTINYVTGVWTRTTTVDVTGIAANYSATYTRYQNNVTSAAGVTTSASGTFTASITVPAVANGNYNVTSIDTQGNRAVATLNVNSAIPESLTIGVVILLSSVAVAVSSRYFLKRPRI
jgi:hypothetical protein